MDWKGRYIIWLWIVASVFVFYERSYAQKSPAALLELKQAGLDVLAEEIKREALRNIVNSQLPDYDAGIDYGVRLGVEGATYSVNFGKIKIQPQSGYLKVQLGIRDVSVGAQRLKLRKKVLNSTLRTTCRNTNIKLGNGSDIPLEAHILLGVKAGRIKVDIPRVNFALKKEQYKVQGPSACSGDLGMGRLIRSLVRSLLERSRGKIEDAIRRRVKDLNDFLEQKLDQNTKLGLDFALEIPPLTRDLIVLQTRPHNVKIDSSRLRIELNASIRKENIGHAKSIGRSKPAILGALGLNPEFLNSVLLNAVGGGQEPIEFDLTGVPRIDDILNTRYASAIWPDLLDAPLTDSMLRLKIGMPAAPKFFLKTNSQYIMLQIPSLVLDFAAPIGGTWTPYFSINVQMLAALHVKEENGIFVLGLASTPSLKVRGNWAMDYKPARDWFERDLVQVILTSLFECIYRSGPLWEGEVNLPEIGGKVLCLSKPRIEPPFLMLNIQS